MPEKELFFSKKNERVPEVEPSEKLEKIRKGLEASLRYLKDIPEEKESSLVREMGDRKLRKIKDFFRGAKFDEKELEQRFWKETFPEWREEFWEAEEEYATIPSPKTVKEQNFFWNSNRGPFEWRIMDGFKAIGETIQEISELTDEGILPLERRIRPIIVVDRKKDNKLAELRNWARELKDIPNEEERMFSIAKEVVIKTGGLLGDEERKIEKKKMRNRRGEIFLGDITVGGCHEGTLLFHVLAGEAETKSRMMRMTEMGFIPEFHEYNQGFLRNGEILVIDTMFPPGGKRNFVELSYEEFKAQGGFPRFGSNRLPFRIYFYQEGPYLRILTRPRFQGGRLGVPGLKELLKPD